MADDNKYLVRILSMPTATARRDRVSSMMAELSPCDWAFFDAIGLDQIDIPYEEERAFLRHGSALAPAELGCAAGHIGMLEALLASDAEFLIALEDDVILDPHVRLDAIVEFMSSCDVDYVKLVARFFVPARYVTSVSRMVFYRASWPPLGTQCYVVSRRGAELMLKSLRATGIDGPIDQAMDAYWRTGLPIVLLYPFPAMEMALPSTINASRPQIKDRNEQLRASLGVHPTKAYRFKEKMRRVLADRRLTNFDVALKQKIDARHSRLWTIFQGERPPLG